MTAKEILHLTIRTELAALQPHSKLTHNAEAGRSFRYFWRHVICPERENQENKPAQQQLRGFVLSLDFR